MSRLRVDFRLMTKTRGYRWFSARARYSQNPDGTIRISGSLQDINFIKAAEEALRAGRDRAREANKAKSDFIAVMSHEVRTPLNAIMGSVEVLKRGRHDKETTELVGLIDDAGRGLLTIVNDLLDVSKIDAGKLEIALSPDRPWRAGKTHGRFLGAAGRQQGSRPEGRLQRSRHRRPADRCRPRAPDRRQPRLQRDQVHGHRNRHGDAVDARGARRPRPRSRSALIDTGPGVPDALAETIFAPFEQAPSNASRGGTGLGLFISRRLARMMGGDLTLEPAR